MLLLFLLLFERAFCCGSCGVGVYASSCECGEDASACGEFVYGSWESSDLLLGEFVGRIRGRFFGALQCEVGGGFRGFSVDPFCCDCAYDEGSAGGFSCEYGAGCALGEALVVDRAEFGEFLRNAPCVCFWESFACESSREAGGAHGSCGDDSACIAACFADSLGLEELFDLGFGELCAGVDAERLGLLCVDHGEALSACADEDAAGAFAVGFEFGDVDCRFALEECWVY